MQKLTECETELLRDVCRLLIMYRPVQLTTDYWKDVASAVANFSSKYGNTPLASNMAVGVYSTLEDESRELLKKEHETLRTQLEQELGMDKVQEAKQNTESKIDLPIYELLKQSENGV